MEVWECLSIFCYLLILSLSYHKCITFNRYNIINSSSLVLNLILKSYSYFYRTGYTIRSHLNQILLVKCNAAKRPTDNQHFDCKTFVWKTYLCMVRNCACLYQGNQLSTTGMTWYSSSRNHINLFQFSSVRLRFETFRQGADAPCVILQSRV